MRASRRKAYQAISTIIGEETCPEITEAISLIKGVKREIPENLYTIDEALEHLDNLRAVNSHLRSALAATLTLLAHPEAKICPNCEEKLPKHGPRCLLDRLMVGVGGPDWSQKR